MRFRREKGERYCGFCGEVVIPIDGLCPNDGKRVRSVSKKAEYKSVVKNGIYSTIKESFVKGENYV